MIFSDSSIRSILCERVYSLVYSLRESGVEYRTLMKTVYSHNDHEAFQHVGVSVMY